MCRFNGPWKFKATTNDQHDGITEIEISDNSGSEVLSVSYYDMTEFEKSQFILMAKAPQLLEAESEIVDCATMPASQVDMGDKLTKLFGIINEIKGEQVE